MTTRLPKLAFARLPAPPPGETLQFYDGYFAALPAGSYTLEVVHTVVPPSGAPLPYSVTQPIVVQAPEFVLDPGVVESMYPPAGGSDTYDQILPYIVLMDPALPWEREITPGAGAATPIVPMPWLALAVFAAGEVYLQPGTNTPATTLTVAELLAPPAGVLGPTLPDGWVTADVLASQCQAITITGAAFQAILPLGTELPLLAHCQARDGAAEGQAFVSAVIANRFPASTAGATRYYAHLISLEGFAAYLGPDGTPLPTKPDSNQLVDVQLASLYGWTFVSVPADGASFEALVAGLVASETATPVLALPVGDGSGVPAAALARLADGYAPLALVTESGDQSFAWYRGPLSAVVPQPLPAVGEPPVAVDAAPTADALAIYLAEQGVFDLSYAAAWNIGRALALADAAFAQQMLALRRGAQQALGAVAQRAALPHLAGAAPRELLARDAARRGFARRIGDGLGRQWAAALTRVRDGEPAPRAHRLRRTRRRRGPSPAAWLARADVRDAIRDAVAGNSAAVSAWLASLALLEPVPFSHLVPDPRMLPPESIRFFYVDPGWLDALAAGATSIAGQSSADAALFAAVRPAAAPPAQAGVLIRSELVAAWPTLVVSASFGGVAVPLLRDDVLAPTVRLCLFASVPDTVTLAEPYHGLQFGAEDTGVAPRVVTSPAFAGAQLDVAPVVPATRPPAEGALGGVVEIGALITALASAAGVIAFASGAVVQWNGAALATTYGGPTSLTATVPAGNLTAAGTALVTVLSGGATSAPLPFTIAAATAAPARAPVRPRARRAPRTADTSPAIDSLSPPVAIAGGFAVTLVVDGSGFGNDAIVQWNGAALSTTYDDAGQVTATVPTANLVAGDVAVTVFTGGVTSPAATFTVLAAALPMIGLLVPASAAAGSGDLSLLVVGGIGPGSLALQLVRAPEQQSFIPGDS